MFEVRSTICSMIGEMYFWLFLWLCYVCYVN